MIIVPRVRTPETLASICAALVSAYQRTFGKALGRTLGELLAAQIWLETARGQSIQNHSPGNVSAGASWPGKAWRPTWFDEPAPDASERIKHLHAEMLAGRAPSAFRAFDSLDDGMADYLRTLKRNFPQILAAGSPEQLAQAIWDSRYTRDLTPAQSAPSLRSLWTEIRKSNVFAALHDSSAAKTGGGILLFALGLVSLFKLGRFLS